MLPEQLPLFLPEAMLAYRCNLRGCCCGGWQIPVRRVDLQRLEQLAPDLKMEELAWQGQVRGVVPEEGEELSFFFRQRQQGGRSVCALLEPDERCTLQRRFGAGALPDVCALFPVRLFSVAHRLEARFSTLCPSVLDALFASQGPMRELCLVGDDGRLQLSLRRTLVRRVDRVLLGERSLAVEQALRLRRLILRALDDPSRSAPEQLGSISAGLEQVAGGADPEKFSASGPFDRATLVEGLFAAAEELAPERLAGELESYRPFLAGTACPEQVLQASPEQLMDALAAWPEYLLELLEPVEETLRPWLLRFLWMRFHGAFHTDGGPFRFDVPRITRMLGLALRLASAFAGLCRRPVDREILQPALGLASFVDSCLP